jgi:hypothetical protein
MCRYNRPIITICIETYFGMVNNTKYKRNIQFIPIYSAISLPLVRLVNNVLVSETNLHHCSVDVTEL